MSIRSISLKWKFTQKQTLSDLKFGIFDDHDPLEILREIMLEILLLKGGKERKSCVSHFPITITDTLNENTSGNDDND